MTSVGKVLSVLLLVVCLMAEDAPRRVGIGASARIVHHSSNIEVAELII